MILVVFETDVVLCNNEFARRFQKVTKRELEQDKRLVLATTFLIDQDLHHH